MKLEKLEQEISEIVKRFPDGKITELQDVMALVTGFKKYNRACRRLGLSPEDCLPKLMAALPNNAEQGGDADD